MPGALRRQVAQQWTPEPLVPDRAASRRFPFEPEAETICHMHQWYQRTRRQPLSTNITPLRGRTTTVINEPTPETTTDKPPGPSASTSVERKQGRLPPVDRGLQQTRRRGRGRRPCAGLRRLRSRESGACPA